MGEQETGKPTFRGGRGNSSVLVVDDEPPVCELLKNFLSGEGYAVRVAYTATDALKHIHETYPDIVLLDIRMPEMDGVECLRQIRKLNVPSAVVMVTAVEDDGVARECLNLGAFEYITKPISLDRLRTCLLLTELFLQK
jgi:two-component system, NtrC family, response regulator HydG